MPQQALMGRLVVDGHVELLYIIGEYAEDIRKSRRLKQAVRAMHHSVAVRREKAYLQFAVLH